MGFECEAKTEIGVLLSAYDGNKTSPITPHPEVPEGRFAAVCCGPNNSFFTVDAVGNVRGDPQKIEREMLLLGADNLTAMAILGLARLAIRASGRSSPIT